MGCDPKAILYYGIKIDKDDDEDDEDDEVDYHEINSQWDKENQPLKPVGDNYKSPEWDAWRTKNQAYEKSKRKVEMAWSGTDECHENGWYIHCAGMEQSVRWDDHLDLCVMDFSTDAEADRNIEEFCTKFGIAMDAAPSWHLCVLYF